MTYSGAGCRLFLRKILLPTDFLPASEAAFQSALELCSLCNAKLLILNVADSATSPISVITDDQFDDECFCDSADRRSVQALVQIAERAGVACRGAIGRGIAATVILNAQRLYEVDLVVMGAHSHDGFGTLGSGSTAEAVLRCAASPVFTVGPQAASISPEQETTGSVVFATDFHSATTQAICCAATFAAMLRLPLHCLHVLPIGVEEGVHKDNISAVMTEALRYLAKTSNPEMVPPVCATAKGSEVSVAVVEYARLHHARLIVLGVRRDSLSASRVQAHITHRIIAEAPCPVLTMAFPLQGPAASTNTFRHEAPSQPGSRLIQ